MSRWFVLFVGLAAWLICGCQGPPLPPPRTEFVPPVNMVLVPAGEFVMGSEEGQLNERPQRKVVVARSFYIDRTEVTCEDFSKFLMAVRPKFLPPPGWTSFEPPKGKEKFSVSSVTVYEAAAYAAWAGKRLPTEEEWEKAARGTDGRRYPWGDRWSPNMGAVSAASRVVTEFANAASPYGCIGMAGNVREWTGSAYTLALKSEPGIPAFLTPFAYLFHGITLKTQYARQVATLESLGGVATDDRVVKGGPYRFRTAFESRSAFRENVEGTERDETIGFRCALDAP